jgi:hypothetical protein
MCRSMNRAQALQNAQSPSNRKMSLGSTRERRLSAARDWTRVVLTPSWCTVIDRYAVPRPLTRGDPSHTGLGRRAGIVAVPCRLVMDVGEWVIPSQHR